jgi:hypothetical protein
MALRQSGDFLAVRMTVRGAEFDHYVLTFDEACFIQALAKPPRPYAGLVRRMRRYPITGIADCCALAASGQATAAPPSSMMKSRLFIL